jgi:hypothetical protein
MVRTRGRRARAVGRGGPRTSRRSRGGARGAARRLTIRTISRLLFAAYFFEAGLILTVAPWSVFWDRNVFISGYPRLATFVQSPYVRGAATGIGVITVIAGLAEFASLLAGRWRSREAPGPADDTSGA